MDIDNLDKLCRTCLQESDDMINLVDTVITYQSDRISLMEILNSFLINNTNAIAAYHFKRLCNDSQNTLNKYLNVVDNEQIKEEPIDIKTETNSVINDNEGIVEELKSVVEEDSNSLDYTRSDDTKINENINIKQGCEENEDNDNTENIEDDTEFENKLGNIQIDFPCQYCEKKFNVKSSLLVHCKNVHGIDRPKIKKMHYCTTCDKGFKKLSVLELHFRTHTGEKPYLCSLCGKTFSSSPTLRSHFLGVHKRNEHPCNMCDKKFSTQACLSRHKKIHTGKRPHICSECDASFYRSYALKIHMKKHTGEKPCVCHECGKGFISEYRLKVHCRVHAPVRRYECEKCGSAFTGAPQLKYHMKKRHS